MAYKISKGKVEKPLLLLIYGPDKVGKSTFAASAPKPIFIQAEEGSNQLDVARLESPKNFREIMEQVAQVAADKDYQTLVIDTLDWMQAMVFEQVCATNDKMVKTIADIPFGRGLNGPHRTRFSVSAGQVDQAVGSYRRGHGNISSPLQAP